MRTASLMVVVAPICGGHATAAARRTANACVEMDGKTCTLTGGSCVSSEACLTVNIGAQVSPGQHSAHPDDFGVTIPKARDRRRRGRVFHQGRHALRDRPSQRRCHRGRAIASSPLLRGVGLRKCWLTC